jgi:UDP-N-acetylmuramoyl-L-alanyl-D-glutamate--2,6-diaminopimelate ligase
MLALSEILSGTTILRTGGDPDILSIHVEPRQLAERDLYFKLRSQHVRISAADAIRQGTRYIVLESGDEEEATLPANAPYAVVDNVNRAFARACSRLFGDAHRQLTIIGVTGAKGKTTVCHLIEAALRGCGIRTGLISSLVFRLPEAERPSAIAIADSFSLHSFLATLRRMGGTHAVLELPSAAIAEERLFGLQFSALAFTNAGTDDSGAHMAVNRSLFADPAFHQSPAALCAFNSDDAAARELAGASPGRVVTFGFGAADVRPEHYSSDRAGISVRLNGREQRFPLIGRPNAMNVLAAAAVVGGIAQTEDAVLQLQTIRPLPGRMERLPAQGDVDVYLDQAYTPGDIEVALAAVKEFAGPRRIVCVASSAGGSDRRQRALRARAAVNASDLCILTSDDPGDEHPSSIVMDMVKGAGLAPSGRVRTIIDRRTAIAVAIREAAPDGIVVLLGKRVTGTEQRNDDRRVATDVLHETARARPS